MGLECGRGQVPERRPHAERTAAERGTYRTGEHRHLTPGALHMLGGCWVGLLFNPTRLPRGEQRGMGRRPMGFLSCQGVVLNPRYANSGDSFLDCCFYSFLKK